MPTTCSVPYVRGSATSRAAASALKPSAKTIETRILRAIAKSRRGLTCAEIEVAMPQLRQSTVSARVAELKALRLVDVIGQRKTPRGRDADVLAVTSRGMKQVAQ